VNSTPLTEKQQEVLWMRYDQKATIEQIAAWLKISRRAVLTRLRNARRRAASNGQPLPPPRMRLKGMPKTRVYPVSQLPAGSPDGSLDMGQV
jgi:DNA-binding CsgD family transcriptional regulator